MVSVTGVAGWCRANPRSHHGMVRTGTNALLDAADPGRVLIAGFAVRDATLDDVFLTLTGHAQETAHV